MNKKIIIIFTLFLPISLFSMQKPDTGEAEPTTSMEFSFSHTSEPQSLQMLMDKQPQLIASRIKGAWLDLSDLNINSLEGIQNIANSITLESLTISNNPLETLDENIMKYFPNLYTLNASNAQIKKLAPYTFHKNNKLKILNLSDNPLREIDRRHWVGIPNLEVLNLNNTGLTHIDFDTFAGLPKLKILVLSKNKLQNFNPKIVILLTKLNALNLAGNPVDKEIIEALKKEFPRVRIFSKDLNE